MMTQNHHFGIIALSNILVQRELIFCQVFPFEICLYLCLGAILNFLLETKKYDTSVLKIVSQKKRKEKKEVSLRFNYFILHTLPQAL